jgi:hypothetical protein
MKTPLNSHNLKLNKLNNYLCTEFYHSCYTLAHGEIVTKNTKRDDIVILVSIVKSNQTCFNSIFDLVDSDVKCRELFKNDKTMLGMYQQTLIPEEYCVTLIYVPKRYKVKRNTHPYSYISNVCVNNIEDFLVNKDFDTELQNKIAELVDLYDRYIL